MRFTMAPDDLYRCMQVWLQVLKCVFMGSSAIISDTCVYVSINPFFGCIGRSGHTFHVVFSMVLCGFAVRCPL